MQQLRRMWINQPSALQDHHALHGTNVLAQHEYDDTYRVYFLSGRTESMQIFLRHLSPGWNPNNPENLAQHCDNAMIRG